MQKPILISICLFFLTLAGCSGGSNNSAGAGQKIHPASWNNDPLIGHQQNFQGTLSDKTPWTTCANGACHGTTLQGSSGPSCQNAACHNTGTNGWPPAPANHIGYSPASNGTHGLGAKGVTNPALSMGNYCLMCHGTPTNALQTRFNGGFVSNPAILNNANGNCSACHTAATAHPTNWVSTRPGNVVNHNDGNITAHPNIKSDSCALCHNTTSGSPNSSPFPGAPTCFDSGFNGTNNCHPGGPGGAGHVTLAKDGIDYTQPDLHGPDAKANLIYCQTCHATAGGAGSNPRFNIPTGRLSAGSGLGNNIQNGCELCHPIGAAHPTGQDRWTFNTDTAYPTRRTHFAAGLDGTNPRNLSGCSLCHNVTAADSNTSPAKACTTCHLSLTATGPSKGLLCTYCHAAPPAGSADLTGGTGVNHIGILTGGLDVSAIPLHQKCSLCHGASENGTTGQLATAYPADYLLTNYTQATAKTDATYEGGDHLDGNLEMNVGGAGYSRSNTPAYSCTKSCHATEVGHVFTNSGLTLESGNFGSGACNSCHDYPPNGGAWPDGRALSSTNHLSLGPLGRTGAGLTDAQFYANHDVCAVCHGVKGNKTPPTLATARTGAVDLSLSGGDKYLEPDYHNDGKVQMNGYDATVPGADATSDNNARYDGAGGCTNACHPTGTSYKLTPSGANTVQKREFGGGCNACHGYPPTSGAHTKHAGGGSNYSYDCQVCHTSPFDGTTHNQSGMTPGSGTLNPALVNIKAQLGGFGNIPAAGTFDSVTKNCSNTYCHGTGTPTWSPASAVSCGDCHGDANGRPGTPGSGGNHFTPGHSTTATNCDFCHPHNGNDVLQHVNGPADKTNTPYRYVATVGTTGTANNKLGTHTYGNVTLGTEASTLFSYTQSTCSSNAAGCHVSPGKWGGTGACDACHFVGNTVGAPEVTSSSTHVKTTTTGAFGACTDCHSGHVGSGGVTIELPPKNWQNPVDNSETHVTGDMQTALGIDYTTHGGINLGGPGTVNSISTKGTEAEICWSCHDANGIGELASGGGATYKFGVLSTSQTLTANHVSDWTTPNAWRIDAYASILTRPIASVHSVNMSGTVGHSSSVTNNVDASGRVNRGALNGFLPGNASGQGNSSAVVLEDKKYIRCSYCHDVHSLGRNGYKPAGTPYLRGSWLSDPYQADVPPNGDYNVSTNYFIAAQTNGMPRVKAESIGDGYYIDQNSGNPTSGKTLANSAGLCTLCHGSDVDNMDYYTSSSLWRTTNGHSNAAIGGMGSNARNLFDARRGLSTYFMAMQDRISAATNSGTLPWGPILNRTKPDAVRNSGWYGGTVGSITPGGGYSAWYSLNGIGSHTGVSGDLAHEFSCSKCHSPHATGLPALLKTNCLDVQLNAWTNSSNSAVNYNAAQANNCHRKTSTTEGWNNLAPKQ
ncbi:CxxxxCH/CxxCH domain c-type cytochrome [Geopsychrobacter electrodiphilus]|uniref:CxxxxCH/CxxCH domain c-type cytochrome n=1 Tax=Geopsychrobacter electrodiphilus TaxID=225196 RepID=UPI00036EE310|nr:CxxxxCH/CxxCH domain-containing protein [Geopsychrobacter electrodiphilus]